jgi:acyl-CoA synthetase (AMP-forming)/AMP-acid ligase II
MGRARERLGNALLGLGLRKGDRVALLGYNCLEWMEMYVALARAGLVAVPINFRLVAAEIEYIVTHCEARRVHRAGRARRARRPDPRQLGIVANGYICFGGERAPAGWQSYETVMARASTSSPGIEVVPPTPGR